MSEEALQVAEKRREAKGKGERGNIYPIGCIILEKARRDKQAFLSEQCKEIEQNSKMGKTRKGVFIPIPKKGNAKECSNYRTIMFISQARKVMLKIL